jgi:hypothetical protein
VVTGEGTLLSICHRLGVLRRSRPLARIFEVAVRGVWWMRDAFGPYLDLTDGIAWGRKGTVPNENQLFTRSRPLPNALNPLEVLAGAISCGFKSRSPHHILNWVSCL